MADLSSGYQPVALIRDKSDPHQPRWNYQATLKQYNITSPYAVIHLAGAGIADKRWTAEYKKLIFDSRIHGTDWLVKEIKKHQQKPLAFLCASAIGFYGHRPGAILTEDSEPGNNFVAELSQQWEQSAD